jgi:hypothetical protein
LKPQRVEISPEQVHQLLEQAKGRLDAETYQALEALVQTLAYFTELAKKKDMTIRKLRQMLFGSKTETLENVTGKAASSEDSEEAQEGAGSAGAEPTSKPDTSEESEATTASEAPEASKPEKPADPDDANQPEEKRKGHGRKSAEEYPGATTVECKHATLCPGQACPVPGCTGKLYTFGPRKIMNITGGAPLQAIIWKLQQLRCNLCLEIFTAAIPPQVKPEKYDATAVSMIALLRYGTGVPFWRLQGLQWSLGIPLASSTQWDLVKEAAQKLEPIYEELIRQAAQGDVLYNDDTNMKILSLMSKEEKKSGAG